MTDLERALAAALSTRGCPCPDECSCDAAVEERARAVSIQDWRDLSDARLTAQQIRRTEHSA